LLRTLLDRTNGTLVREICANGPFVPQEVVVAAGSAAAAAAAAAPAATGGHRRGRAGGPAADGDGGEELDGVVVPCGAGRRVA
jgi:hypothetical protein